MFQQVLPPKGQMSFNRLTDDRAAGQTGRLVCSARGRDRGRYYLVIGSDKTARVKVADGVIRKVENPKLKNVRHLYYYDVIAEGMRAKAESGKRVTNVDLRRELKSLLESDEKVQDNT